MRKPRDSVTQVSCGRKYIPGLHPDDFQTHTLSSGDIVKIDARKSGILNQTLAELCRA
jgi:hypothetical protein